LRAFARSRAAALGSWNLNGLGPAQRRVRRLLVRAGGKPISTRELRKLPHQRHTIWYALQRYAVRDRWGYWRPNDELMKLIVGEARHSDSVQQQILEEKPDV
jgi:hypothetical protein